MLAFATAIASASMAAVVMRALGFQSHYAPA
jgi:hypothetical protein